MAPASVSQWSEHLSDLAERYPTPSDVPDLDLPSNTSVPPPTWHEWAKAWRVHYDATAPAKHTPSVDGMPTMPPPGASDKEWRRWAEAYVAFDEKKRSAEHFLQSECHESSDL